ncbi:very short patch repair endonuclease [Treponema phagedenis]|uniref:very short patch repair endonuclease n=1 Tax=Treponema phagedenis TaxID=162 RepID=UPI0011E7C8B8|nr:very short patch repair endonuclease [Treponema phagedenis]QEK00890.1 DNA mismatch endonuclease Vsr [Treponema phagedenis]QEK05898.1 DNA mismatch endonuclease Vsr [Treponema phagedenis]
MPDKFSKAKRSDIMSKISGKETKPEIMVRKYLFAHGFRYRKNVANLPGKPDIALPKYKTVIFVNGCFWHGHKNCKNAELPTTNTEFWRIKISATIERDKRQKLELQKIGYRVLTVWQCELTAKKREHTLENLISEITLAPEQYCH